MIIERRYAGAIESDGMTVRGVAIKYGDAARLPGGRRERIEAGAFGNVTDAILNRQHDRGRPLARQPDTLTIIDTAESMRIEARIVDTVDGRDARELIRAGVLTGLSVEMHVESERMDGDMRIVERARLVGVAIVDRPAYEESLIDRAEVRMAGDGGVELRFFYNRDHVIRDRAEFGLPEVRKRWGRGYGAAGNGRRDKVRKQRIRAGAFKRSLADADNEITVTLGARDGKPLGSKTSGSAVFVDTPEFLQAVVKQLPATGYVRDWKAAVDSGAATYGVAPLYRKSTRDGAVEIIPEQGNEGVNIEVVNEATLTGVAVVQRPPKGNPGEVKLDGGNVGKRMRNRTWL